MRTLTGVEKPHALCFGALLDEIVAFEDSQGFHADKYQTLYGRREVSEDLLRHFF